MDREKITQKYLFMALDEMSKNKGTVKKGRLIEKLYKEEIIKFETQSKKPEKIQFKL